MALEQKLEQIAAQNAPPPEIATPAPVEDPLKVAPPRGYKTAPPQVLETYRKLGFVPLRSTVEALGLRVRFNPEQRNSTIYDPGNPGRHYTIGSFVSYGVAFSSIQDLSMAVRAIRDEMAEQPAEAPMDGMPAKTPFGEAPVGEQATPQGMDIMQALIQAKGGMGNLDGQAPQMPQAPPWPQDPATQRLHLMQAVQPAASLQQGFPVQGAAPDAVRAQLLMHMLAQQHRRPGVPGI